ncbi:MAG: hypothetical protein K0R14_121 [Burkholderiales bacterium]|nr:hypothetical protein [Burkholderiales bacterium]
MKKYLFFIVCMIASINSMAETVTRSDEDNTGFCSSQVRSGLTYFINTWDVVLPIVGETTKQIIEDVCPSETERDINKLRKELNTRIDDVSDRVESLDERLSTVGFNAMSAISDLYSLDAASKTDNFEKELSDFDTLFYGKYTGFLDGLGKNSLYDYFSQYSKEERLKKFKQIYNASDDFKSQFTNTENIIQSFDDIIAGNSAITLRRNLVSMCKDPVKITEEIIAKRKICNTMVSYITLNVTSRMLEVKRMLFDIIKTEQLLDEDLRNDGWFGIREKGYDMRGFNNNRVSWANAQGEVNKIDTHYNFIQKSLLGEDSKGDKGIYKLFDGFSQELMNSMKEASCPNWPEKWYSDLVGGKPYIVMRCQQSSNYYVTSKYYLKGGDKVRNILGVLVPVNAKRLYTDLFRLTNYVHAKFTAYWKEGESNYDTVSFLFNLNSDLPLIINPDMVSKYSYSDKTILREEDNKFVMPRYGISAFFPYYYTSSGRRSDEYSAAMGQFGKHSTLLWSANNSNTEFKSLVHNFVAYSHDPGDTVETKGTVFLGFEKDGITYAFGLMIHSFGGRLLPNLFGTAFEFSQDRIPVEEISLVCLADSQCTIPADDRKMILWNDGTYVKISESGSNLSLSYGVKPSGSK